MALDPYAPCPCGSGKKLKFCCAPIVEDMTKAVQFQANEQPRLALSILEKLEKSHPDNAWVATTHADLLLGLDEVQEAKERLQAFLKRQPDYPPALATLALATLFKDGYAAARPTIQRAFQKCVSHFPKNAGLLAFSVATLFIETETNTMAARQYLSLAARLMGDEEREAVFHALLKLDGDVGLAYPLRSVQNLGNDSARGPVAGEAAKAVALSNIGCWNAAARIFTRIAEADPKNAVVWRNAALCRAWDADEAGAAEAFHHAAETCEDFALAVECETLAQICESQAPAALIPIRNFHYRVRSPARLLGQLRNHELISSAFPDHEEDPSFAGQFLIRNKPLLDPAANDPAIDEIPFVVASVRILDRDPEADSDGHAILQGHAAPELAAAKELFEQIGQDEISLLPEIESGESFGGIPPAEFPFSRGMVLQDALPGPLRRDLVIKRQQHLVNDVWMHAPQGALNGKSPTELRGQAASRVPLTAAVYALDALTQRLGQTLELEALLERLQLEPLPPLEPTSELPLTSLSAMQLHRLPVSRLSDAQLIHAHRRAILIGHRRFIKEVCRELLARPQVLDQVDVGRVYGALIKSVRGDGQIEEAIAYAVEAKEWAAKQSNAFESVLTWSINEFALRLEGSLDAPELQHLYRLLSEYYAPKVPEISSILEGFARQYADRIPWLRGGDLLVETGAAATGGIWTPGGAAAAAAPGGKLWLPGQE